jgi:2-polyprenyl-3-methyl-5-hydroxy-6-metoxy-1,4-benzoquinol methylase
MKGFDCILLLIFHSLCWKGLYSSLEQQAQHTASIHHNHHAHQLHPSTEKQWVYRSAEAWDKEFTGGGWDFLNTVPLERMRMSAVSGLTRLYGTPPNGTILDVGCGEGVISEYLSEEQKKHYIGVDISKVAIQRAEKLRGAPMTWVTALAHEYAPPHLVDVIIFSEMLYYVEHEKVLKQYESYLTPNGKIIISLYCPEKKTAMFSKIRTFTRDYFKLVDDYELSGNSLDGKVIIRIDVFQKKA